jgi:hypothetical protein
MLMIDDNVATGCYESHWNDSRCIRATAVILLAMVVESSKVVGCNLQHLLRSTKGSACHVM